MKTFVSLAFMSLLLYTGNLLAKSPLGTVDDVMGLLTKEVGLKATQKPAVKGVVSEYATKFADLAKSDLSQVAKLQAGNALYDKLKTALGKFLSAEQLAKLDGLKAQVTSMFGLKL